MITMRKLAISAAATLGLFVFGAVNSANAGHPVSGKPMGHGPVVNSSGKIGSGKVDGNKFDKDRKEWEYRYWDRYTCRYDYCSPVCSCPVETCAPVCEVPVCPEPVVVPTCCESPCSYDFCKPYEFHRTCYDGCYPWHRERPLENNKPTTASSHRNTENLGSVASHTSSGRGRK
jgi:hypothetical protein